MEIAILFVFVGIFGSIGCLALPVWLIARRRGY